MITPVLNALCVIANRSELEPIVYELEPPYMDPGLWPMLPLFRPFDVKYNNHTVLDSIFDWHDMYDNDSSTWESRAVHARPGRQTKMRFISHFT